jgi:hypothetical protein
MTSLARARSLMLLNLFSLSSDCPALGDRNNSELFTADCISRLALRCDFFSYFQVDGIMLCAIQILSRHRVQSD